MYPKENHKHLFNMLALAYDVSKAKLGFIIIVYVEKYVDLLRYLHRSLLEFLQIGWAIPLTYIERFKVLSERKDSNGQSTFEYFGALKVKLPPGVTVDAK